jgi:hypothetical protein
MFANHARIIPLAQSLAIRSYGDPGLFANSYPICPKLRCWLAVAGLLRAGWCPGQGGVVERGSSRGTSSFLRAVPNELVPPSHDAVSLPEYKPVSRTAAKRREP